MGMKLPPEVEAKVLAQAASPSSLSPPAAGIREKQFQARILAVARDRGWLVYHTHDSRRSQPGFPDLVLTRNGRVIFAELKTDTGSLAPAQCQWITTLQLADCTRVRTYVWRPRDWREIVEVLL